MKTNKEFLQMEVDQLTQQNKNLQKKLDNMEMEHNIQSQQNQSQLKFEDRVVSLQQENNQLKLENE